MVGVVGSRETRIKKIISHSMCRAYIEVSGGCMQAITITAQHEILVSLSMTIIFMDEITKNI